MKAKHYVGMNEGTRTVFRSISAPTEETHGNQFLAVMGPFQTLRGATFAAEHGRGNPHIQTVADAERLARKAGK